MKLKRIFICIPMMLVIILLAQVTVAQASSISNDSLKRINSNIVNAEAGYTGMKEINGEWYYFVNGNVASTYTGFVKYNSKLWYVNKGKIDKSYVGFVKYNSKFWYVNNGKIDDTYTGFVKYNSKFWYVNKGKIDESYVGFVKYNSKFWYVNKGKIDESYTGFVKYNSMYWYVYKGKIADTYTGFVKYNSKLWYVNKGKIADTYTGIVKYNSNLWYISKGKLDETYTGLAGYNNLLIYVTNGKFNSGYNGTIKKDNVTYRIEAGIVVNQSEETKGTKVTNVKLNAASLNLYKGGTAQLTATVEPSTASNKNVTWSSSNTSVATVNANGLVTAVGNGTATITAKTADGGKTVSCTVTVTTKVIGVSITNNTILRLDVNSTYQCAIAIKPSTASNKNVTWSSSDTNIAKVDSTGKITAVGPGVATITVKTNDGGYTDFIQIYVYQTNAPIPAGDIWYKVSLASTPNVVMDVNEGSTFNGAKVQLCAFNGTSAQLWQFHAYRNSTGGIAIVPKCNSGGYILDVNRGTSYSTPFAENNLIDLWMIGEDNAASMWQLVKLWDGSYIFKLVNTDWVAGVTSTASGAQLMLRKFDVTDMNQRWYLEGVEVKGDSISDNDMTSVVAKAGKQTDYKYGETSTIMCSVYCMTYVRGYLYNDYTTPNNYWSSNGAVWSLGGGTWREGDVLSIARQYIDNGKPVIIHVDWAPYGTHYVVAYSYSGSGTLLSDFKVVDPWDGKIKSLSTFTLYADHQIITFE